MERIIYELKYCERCGSLCTRRSDSSDTYCDACTQIMTHVCLPVSAVGRLRFRRKMRENEVLQTAMEKLLRSLQFSGRLSVIVKNGTILKSGYEESYFTRRQDERMIS